jgi:response regulator of citrate/malate metabolism
MDPKKSMLIFVVEDNLLFNQMVCEYLKKNNFNNIKSFTTGNDCIKAVLNGEKPDIVIQDYFLDDTNGLEVLKAVKKQSKKSEFIFLTANDDISVVIDSMKSGALDYIIKDKGVALNKLVDKVNKVTKLILIKRKNKAIRIAMILTLLVLFLIILTGLLLFFTGVIVIG